MLRPIGVAFAAAVLGSATAAHAHVVAHPGSAAAGSYVETMFTVGHGCHGSPTIALRVKIPDGVEAVKPQMKAGWTVAIKTRKLDTPRRTAEGQTVGETIDEVDWEGGSLPDSLYDSFGMLMKLPETAGQTVYFPTFQECPQGSRHWAEIPAAGQSERDLHDPAPFVRLTPKQP